jgi:phospholipid/cholesterol/gamma-HCH transport system permease protein
MSETVAQPPLTAFAVKGDGERLSIEGALDIHTLTEAQGALGSWMKGRKPRALDIGGLSGLDTPGALFLCGLRAKQVELTGVRPEHKRLLDLVCALKLAPLPKVPVVARWRQLVIGLGRGAHEARIETAEVVTFVGRATSALVRALLHPARLRFASISRQVSETGIDALPIAIMTAMRPTIGRASCSCGPTAARTSRSTSWRCRCCARWAS